MHINLVIFIWSYLFGHVNKPQIFKKFLEMLQVMVFSLLNFVFRTKLSSPIRWFYFNQSVYPSIHPPNPPNVQLVGYVGRGGGGVVLIMPALNGGDCKSELL